MKHNCGGTLVEAQVMVFPDENSTAFINVPGLRCTTCGEELLRPDTVRNLLRDHGR